jgi:soluble lytic murein transglycosylase-like protein
MNIILDYRRCAPRLGLKLGLNLGLGLSLLCAAAMTCASSLLSSDDAVLNHCVSAASGYHQVNPHVLKAILRVESKLNTQAINRNKNGTVDVGIAQINSVHFKELSKFGISPQHLMNACISTYVAAWHLKKQLTQYGNTWFAIGAYHSAHQPYNRRYALRVFKQLDILGKIPRPHPKSESPHINFSN